ncbi:hypothetical protein TNIN_277541 [Trichonephila inaurata madagascariensis]|uniref:Uncharacterized protein n=1 Tax=Trichonephila inaurata madagascariensis TaxID=2747483 RepID=A0A8X6XX60_9ARAC|nr:hypothetical protein TNIN_277541 [Trichonephila inaurata madagascariensis]
MSVLLTNLQLSPNRQIMTVVQRVVQVAQKSHLTANKDARTSFNFDYCGCNWEKKGLLALKKTFIKPFWNSCNLIILRKLLIPFMSHGFQLFNHYIFD